MEKITYWLKKLGILRTGVYTAKGDAKKVVEMEINSELYQSDKEIEKEFEQKTSNEQQPGKKSGGMAGKITFWIFVAVGIFFFLAFWGGGWNFWKILRVVLWVWFLRWMWVHITGGIFAVGKILLLGAVIIVFSFIVASPDEEGVTNVGSGNEKEIAESEKAYLEDGVEDDFIVKFLLKLQQDTDISFSKIQNDDIVWPGGPGLQLQKTKSFGAENLSAEDFDTLQKFFVDLGADNGGLGFEFVPPAGTQSDGFALRDEVYGGMMCVLMGIDNEGVMVGCGWGPTQNPNKDK